MGSLTQVQVSKGDKDRVWCVAWSPNGTRPSLLPPASRQVPFSLAVDRKRSSKYGNLRKASGSVLPFWMSYIQEQLDAFVGHQKVGVLDGHESEVKCVDWHPQGRLIATCGRDRAIWIWEATGPFDYECVDVKHEHTQDIKVIKWHPSGKFLVSGSYDNTVKIWKEDEEEEWTVRQTLDAHDSTVWSLDFLPDGRHMITCSDDRTLKIWKVDSEKPKLTLTTSLTGYHNRTIYSIHVSLHGYIATGCGDDGLRLFKVEEGDQPKTAMIAHISKAHDSDVNCVRWHPSNPSLLLSAGDDGCIKLWTFTKEEI